MSDSTTTTSRRELNKLATRQAISAAALNVLRSKGVGNFTVEDIAEEAGVSRRTFFNYFSSLEAALASVTEGFLHHALEQFRLRPAGEPILESARAALMALADPMTVSPMAELFSLTQEHPALARCELEAWDQCTTQIIDAARHRLGPDANELYLRALAGSIISCGKAAMSVWFEQRGRDISAESLAVLREHLIEAIRILGSGFTATDQAAQSAQSPSPSA